MKIQWFLLMLWVAAVWGILVGTWLAKRTRPHYDPSDRLERECLERLARMENSFLAGKVVE